MSTGAESSTSSCASGPTSRELASSTIWERTSFLLVGSVAIALLRPEVPRSDQRDPKPEAARAPWIGNRRREFSVCSDRDHAVDSQVVDGPGQRVAALPEKVEQVLRHLPGRASDEQSLLFTVALLLLKADLVASVSRQAFATS